MEDPMPTKILPVLVSTVSILGAADLDEVRSVLKSLHPMGVISATARFTVREEHPSNRKSGPIEQRFQVRLRSAGDELWIHWPETQDEKGAPWARDPKELRQLLDQAKVLLAWLDRGHLVSPSQVQVATASPIRFHLPPELPARLRRRLKEPEGTLLLWLDKAGMPQKAILEQSFSGRTQRIAPDETLHTRLQVTFHLAGGRLVARRLEEDCEESVGYDVVKRHREIEMDPIICAD
jgi:hypothetical protein